MEALKSIDLGKNVRRGLKITWVGEASKLSPWFNEVLRMLGSYCLCDISVFSWFKNDSGVVILGAAAVVQTAEILQAASYSLQEYAAVL